MKADKNPNTAGAQEILGSSNLTDEIIHKAKQGEIDVLYVFGQDLVKLYSKDVVVEISKKVKLFVYQGSNINETCSYATLNLPSAVYAEKEGTFTNCQNRVQRIWPAFAPLGESKGDWQILLLLSDKVGKGFSYKNTQELFKDVAAHVPAFAGMTYDKLDDQGMILTK
jgi:predicted molibdopterin-dependent oxidoreductase YjgC